MEVPLLVFAIVGLLQGSFAEKVCLIPGQTIASPSDQTYYYKCLAPGVSVQLRCPPGQYFIEGGDKCITGISSGGFPFGVNPGMPVHQDTQTAKAVPTAPTPAVTAPTQKPVVDPTINRPNNPNDPGSQAVPAKAPISPAGGKKGPKTTKRQRATTPAGKPVSKRKTTAAANGPPKKVSPKRRKTQN